MAQFNIFWIKEENGCEFLEDAEKSKQVHDTIFSNLIKDESTIPPAILVGVFSAFNTYDQNKNKWCLLATLVSIVQSTSDMD
jgi:hypothetical protein